MNVCNFHYNHQFQFIVCLKHDYCVFFKKLRRHLQREHDFKNFSLHATLIEIVNFQIRDSFRVRHFNDDSFIFHFSIVIDYRCKFIACNSINNALITNLSIVTKHLTNVHDIENDKNKIKSIDQKIDTICVQFLFVDNYFRFFVVRSAFSQQNQIQTSFFSIVNHVSSTHENLNAFVTNKNFCATIIQTFEHKYANCQQQ